MSQTIKIIGTTDTVGTCDCCGRTDLKKTVVLDRDGSRSFFGTACAARAMGRATSKGLMSEAMDAQILADRELVIQKRAAAQQVERDARRARLMEMSRKDFAMRTA